MSSRVFFSVLVKETHDKDIFSINIVMFIPDTVEEGYLQLED